MSGSKTGNDSLPDSNAGNSARSPTFTARARSIRDRAERRALLLTGIGTLILLVGMFYYPVATVFREAIYIDGVATIGIFLEILRDPIYFGELSRFLDGKPLTDVLHDLPRANRPFGIVGFTAYQAFLSTIASLALGLPLAYLLARYEFWGRRTIRSLTILPFVLPSMMVAVGFYATFGSQGTVNTLLGWLGLGSLDLMGTLTIIIVAHAFYNAPLVARIVTASWESVDASAVETARSLGANRRRAFLDIVAPQLYPAILMSGALTFVFTFGTFPIVLALAGFDLATVEVFVYRLINRFDYAEAAGLAIIELAISLAILYGYLRYESRQRTKTRGVRLLPRKPLRPPDRSAATLLARAGIAGYVVIALIVFVLPIASMIQASFTGPTGFTLDNYQFLIERQTEGADFQAQPWPAVRNSLVFGFATLLVALPMGVTVAVLTTRRYRGRKLVDVITMAPLAVSGIIIGLGLLRGLVFGIEIAGYRLIVGGAVAIVAGHAVAGYPFVVRTVAPGLETLDPRLLESARSLGASRVRALLDIELPLVWPGVVAGAAFAFAISIGEFSSTIILAEGANEYTMPIAIERFIGRRLGAATAMGTVLLVVTSISFIVIDRLGGEHSGL